MGGYQKVLISGIPGTELYTSSDFGGEVDKIGEIGSDGRLKYKASRDTYELLLVRYPNDENYIPYALDYKNKRHVFPLVMSVAIPIYYPLFNCNYVCSDQVLYGWIYEKEQAVSAAPPKRIPYANTGERREVKGQASGSLLKKSRTMNSFKKLLDRNYGGILQGTYVCDGKLSKHQEVIESYANMILVLKRKDDKKVSVEVLMDGNERIFEPLDFIVDSKGNGKFELFSKLMDYIEIEISNNEIKYANYKVNIEGEIYQLKIEGSKRD